MDVNGVVEGRDRGEDPPDNGERFQTSSPRCSLAKSTGRVALSILTFPFVSSDIRLDGIKKFGVKGISGGTPMESMEGVGERAEATLRATVAVVNVVMADAVDWRASAEETRLVIVRSAD